jgi:hypothetical protein
MPAQQQHWIRTAYLSGATGPVTAGLALVSNGTRYVVATTANRASYGRAEGIAITAGDNDDTQIEIQSAGTVPNSITGLGTGTATWVIVSATGSLERDETPDVGEDVIGRCNARGDVAVAPFVWDSTNVSPGGGDTLPDPTGHAGDALVVNGAGDDYELADVVDIPALAGNGGKIVAVNADATALEYVRRGGRTTITFADANVDLTGAPYSLTRDQIAGAIVKVAGTNTATRDLTFPLPATEADSYVVTIENAVNPTFGVRLKMSSGGTWTLPPATGGATHHAAFTPSGVTLLGPSGVPSAQGVQYITTSGYFGAIPMGSALQVFRVNAAGNGYEFAAAGGGGGSPGGSSGEIQTNDGAGGFAGATNVKAGSGFVSVGAGTVHASALIRLAYAATDVVIGAPNNGGTDYPVLHRTSANSWRFGDAAGWNTSVYGDVVTFYGASGTTMYAPGGSVVAIEFAASANIGLFDGAGFGGGSKVLSVANATTEPTSNPAGGAQWWVFGGASKARGSSGTITTFGPADPHCPTCGRDFATEHRNDDMGEHLAVCLPCLIDTLKDAGIDTNKFAMVDKRGASKAAWDDNHAKAKARSLAAETARAEVERDRRMAHAREAALRAVARDAREAK